MTLAPSFQPSPCFVAGTWFRVAMTLIRNLHVTYHLEAGRNELKFIAQTEHINLPQMSFALRTYDAFVHLPWVHYWYTIALEKAKKLRLVLKMT